MLFGAWLFASSLEVVVHEAGHVLAAWTLGAQVDRFEAHPFRRSEVVISYDGGRRAASSVWFSSAGIAVALAVGAAAYLVCRRRSSYLLPVAMLWPAALAAEGAYLIGGSLGEYGDPTAIASLSHLPPVTLAAMGCLMAGGALAVGLRLMARVGVDHEAGWTARVLALLAVAAVSLPGAVYAAEAQDSFGTVVMVLLVGAAVLGVAKR